MLNNEIETTLEGYYRWVMDTVTDSFNLPRVLGTGKVPKLIPSEAKAALEALIKQAEEEAYKRGYTNGFRDSESGVPDEL
jgi:hypothetical protein